MRQERRGIGHVNAGVKGARKEGVIHAVEHVCQRGVLGKDGLVERRPGIAALQEINLGIIGLFEGRNDSCAGSKGVVRHDGQGDGAFRGAACQDEQDQQREKGKAFHNKLLT